MMYRFMFLIVAANIYASGFELGFLFRPSTNHAFGLKSPWEPSASEEERLLEKKSRRIGWTEEDEIRLEQLKKDKKITIYNLFIRLMAKLGFAVSGESVENSSSSSAAAPVSIALFQGADFIQGVPKSISLPGLGSTGAGGGGGGQPSSASGGSQSGAQPSAVLNSEPDLKEVRKRVDLALKNYKEKSPINGQLFKDLHFLIFKSKNQIELTDYFLDLIKQYPDAFKRYGEYDLVRFSSERDALDILEGFIRIKCDINKASEYSKVLPVEASITTYEHRSFHVLISQKNFDPNIRTRDGTPIINIAVRNGMQRPVLFFLCHPKFRKSVAWSESPSSSITVLLQGFDNISNRTSSNLDVSIHPTTGEIVIGRHFFANALNLGNAEAVAWILQQSPQIASQTYTLLEPSGASRRATSLDIILTTYMDFQDTQVPWLIQGYSSCLKIILNHWSGDVKPIVSVLESAASQGFVDFVRTLAHHPILPPSVLVAQNQWKPEIQTIIQWARYLKDKNAPCPENIARESIKQEEKEAVNLLANNIQKRLRLISEIQETKTRLALTDTLLAEHDSFIRGLILERNFIKTELERAARTKEQEQNSLERQRELSARRMIKSEQETLYQAESRQRNLITSEESNTFVSLLTELQNQYTQILAQYEDRLRREHDLREHQVRLHHERNELMFREGDLRIPLEYEYEQWRRRTQAIAELFFASNPLQAATKNKETKQIGTLLRNPETREAWPWSETILSSQQGIETIKTLISDKRVPHLKAVLELMSELHMDPSCFRRFARSKLEVKTKKDEAHQVIRALDRAVAKFGRIVEAYWREQLAIEEFRTLQVLVINMYSELLSRLHPNEATSLFEKTLKDIPDFK